MAKIALVRQGESRTLTIQKLYNCVTPPWLADLHRVRDRKLDQFGHPRLVPRLAKSDELLLQATYHGFKRARRLSRDF
jgi:hypothetical protein